MSGANVAGNLASGYPITDILRLLLASLRIEAILQGSTVSQKRERLVEMTNGLGLEDAYGAAIKRIKAQDGDKSRLGIEALMWITYAERPLKADELCHALAIELPPTSAMVIWTTDRIDFNADNVPSMAAVVGCCQGLVTVDKEGSCVRLIHSTLQEYLSHRANIFGKPHSKIGESCLAYLNSRHVKSLSTYSSTAAKEIPFLEYSSLNWGTHVKREPSEHSGSHGFWVFFNNYKGHISTKLLLGQPRYQLRHPGAGLQLNMLDCASYFGNVELVAVLIKFHAASINKGRFGGYTPLIWAAQNGHEQVVKLLLERGRVNPDKRDEDGETPISHAARNGHAGVVKILLALQNVNPNNPSLCNKPPLSHAAQNGHEEVVKVLLKCKDVNPDQPSYDGQTPLAHAARAGHEGIVKILLRSEKVIPDSHDGRGIRPLSYAAKSGHVGVVEMLLRHPAVCPDKPCRYYGRTAFSYAVEKGYEGVVRRLLGREEVNPDKLDSGGRTPLSYAAWCGREEVVKILLRCHGVNPDKASYDGQTPLSYAAQKGHEGVAKLLLGREEVNPDKPDNHAKTPLICSSGRTSGTGEITTRAGRCRSQHGRSYRPNAPRIFS